jgi:hypothetical protein
MELRKFIKAQLPVFCILGLQTLVLIVVAGAAIGAGSGA